MRRDVKFLSKGLNCRGWLYVPEGLANKKVPAIIMAHGFSAVKEMCLPDYAEKFAAAGFATLVFDYRYFGDSEGEPRCQLFPLEQVEDYRNAISWISNQPEVDPKRIGIWGTSFSGGIVIYVGSYDRRVKAIVAQAPAVRSPEVTRALSTESWERDADYLLKDRILRYETGTVNYIKVVASEDEPCALAMKEAYDFFLGASQLTPSWRNEITVESLEKIREFDPVCVIHFISPSALMLIPVEDDRFVSPDLYRLVYDRAREPKAMHFLPINHFEIYKEPWLSKSADMAINWFKQYL